VAGAATGIGLAFYFQASAHHGLAPVRARALCSVRVLSGEGSVLAAMRNDRLREPQTRNPQLFHILAAQGRVALLHVIQGLLHPGELIRFRRANHAALSDCAEQLVARSFQNRLGGYGTWLLTSFTGQQANLPFCTAAGKSGVICSRAEHLGDSTKI